MMLISANVHELQDVQTAIDHLQKEQPTQYQQFRNIVELARQLQYSFQYLGCLLMDEDPSRFQPRTEDSYVHSIFQREINAVKKDHSFDEVEQLLARYKDISYDHICKLVLGRELEMLVGPVVIK